MSVQSTESFLWLTLADKDEVYLLPLLVSALIFFHCWSGCYNRTRLKLMLYVAVSLLILVLTINLSAATNIYLLVSILLLFVQATWVRRRLSAADDSKSQESVEERYQGLDDNNGGLIPLLVADRISGAGNKAVNLSRMLRWGLPVPDGFVIPPQMINRGIHQFESNILSMFDQLGAQTVVTRSSGGNEDGAQNSHAGIYETRLNVVRQNLMNELNKVVASYVNKRAKIYSTDQKLSGSIVVQEQVDPDYAGVLFTENPAHSGQIVLEYIQGLADDLVSGRKTPQTVTIGRASGDIMTNVPPFDIKPLLVLAYQIEEKIIEEQGHYIPQDIEWAYKKGQFFIIQTRDITARSSHGDDVKSEMERERKRLVDILNDYELSEPREFEDKAKLLDQISKAEEIIEDMTPVVMNLPLMLEAQVKRALTYQNFKEEAKHHCMKPLASIRRLLLHLDKCYQLEGKIFYLSLDELLNEDFEATDTLREKLDDRVSARAALLKNDPPSVLSLSFLERTNIDDEGQFIFESKSTGAIQGQRIAGKQSQTAPIRVLHDLDDIDSVKEGEIIVVKNIDPDLATVLPKVEGIISEVGGMLSHMAILAREFGKTTVSGVKDATKLFSTGQVVYICNDGLVERRVNDRRKLTQSMDAERRVVKDRRLT